MRCDFDVNKHDFNNTRVRGLSPNKTNNVKGCVDCKIDNNETVKKK
jgi:hypothetical protein